ncbi:aminotransferase class V-fold PLP-dependent enzyme [Salmonella enterica subsp. enterica]|nr:aminotransferase class V-fold PLP-dependent enzyme [Salmonella enterica subsp. enterica]
MLRFSGHKLTGFTGIGILYVKEALLQEMPPWERKVADDPTGRPSRNDMGEKPRRF